VKVNFRKSVPLRFTVVGIDFSLRLNRVGIGRKCRWLQIGQISQSQASD